MHADDKSYSRGTVSGSRYVPQLKRCIRPRLSWSLKEKRAGYGGSAASWMTSDIIWDLAASFSKKIWDLVASLIRDWVSVSSSIEPKAMAESQNLWIIEMVASSPVPLLSTYIIFECNQ